MLEILSGVLFSFYISCIHSHVDSNETKYCLGLFKMYVVDILFLYNQIVW